MESKNLFISTINVHGKNDFHHACTNGQLGSLKLLLEKNQNLINELLINEKDTDGNHVIHLAVINGHADIVKYLMEESNTMRIQINAKNKNRESSIQLASSLLDEEMVGLLLKKSDSSNQTFQVKEERAKIAEYYILCYHGNRFKHMNDLLTNPLSRGIDFDATDFDLNTGFHQACLRGNCNIVEVLLQSSSTDINFDAVNNNGDTGFHIACAKEESGIAKILLETKPIGEFNINTAELNTSSNFLLCF